MYVCVCVCVSPPLSSPPMLFKSSSNQSLTSHISTTSQDTCHPPHQACLQIELCNQEMNQLHTRPRMHAGRSKRIPPALPAMFPNGALGISLWHRVETTSSQIHCTHPLLHRQWCPHQGSLIITTASNRLRISHSYVQIHIHTYRPSQIHTLHRVRGVGLHLAAGLLVRFTALNRLRISQSY